MANYAVPDIVQQILDSVGITVRDFSVVETDDKFVEAAAITEGQDRRLLVNPAFLRTINVGQTKNWASAFVLAHEVGHLVLHHSPSIENEKKMELEADGFAGSVCNRLGANLDETLIALRNVQAEESVSKPSQAQRIEAAMQGWKRQKDQKTGALSSK
jgi:hypothetical protein